MLITPDYQAKLQEHVHKKNPIWGNGGYMHCNGVREFAKQLIAEGALSKPTNASPIRLLDYGCGYGTFKSKLIGQKLPPWPMRVVEYDPARVQKRHMPQGQYDIVVCTDVLEHVEEECLEDVLFNIWTKTGVAAYIAIALFAAAEEIAGVGSAHINLKTIPEWEERLEKYFHVSEAKRVARDSAVRVIHYHCRPLNNLRESTAQV